MNYNQLQASRKEIETQKMCHHKNLARLIDVFEEEAMIYLVLEYLKVDLFDYLEARDFNIGEERAK
jgi:serine/threonine protein kinase